MKRPRGYFSVGIYYPKFPINIGSLWRTAYQLGGSEIFVIGSIIDIDLASDTPKAWKHVPFRRYPSFETFLELKPKGCALVGIEEGGKPLETFSHPERAIYLLGNEKNGLPQEVLERCDTIVSLSTINCVSYNVAITGSIVLYDRTFLRKRQGNW